MDRISRLPLTVLRMALLTSPWVPAQALTIIDYNPTVHERFTAGFSSNPVPNTSGAFIGAGYDFSGVGWQTGSPAFAVTMITPQNFVTAAHAAPAVNSTVTFLNSDGVLKTYTVGAVSSVSYNGQSSDLVVGTLTQAIAPVDQVTSYSIWYNGTVGSSPTLAGYTTSSLLVYGQGGRIGANTIDGFVEGDLYPLGSPNGIADSLYFYTGFNATTGQTQGQGGDSGSPTFAVFGGALRIVGVHSAIGTIDGNPLQLTFDNFLAWPSILSQIDTVAAGSGQSVSLYVTAIPEPATAAFVLGALALGGVAWRRRV